MIFGLHVSYSPPHYPRQKNKEIEIAENEINAFKSQQVLSTAQTSDISIAIHSNSIVRQRFTYRFTDPCY